MTEIVVGGYAAVPQDPSAAAGYWDGIAALDVQGLEYSWFATPIEPQVVAADWRHVITTVGRTVGRVADDAAFGLGSKDADGRAAALADARLLRDHIEAANDSAGRRVVRAVELHAGPRDGAGSIEALRASAHELAALDWSGADLTIEHCDAAVPGQVAAKGFLPLEDELAALAGTGVGVVINWGRSAIELRDPDRVVEHLRAAREAGALRGLMFSGACDLDTEFGAAWSDAHMPLADPDWAPHSLLTRARIAAALDAAGELPWVGVKVARRSDLAPEPARTVAAVSAALAAR